MTMPDKSNAAGDADALCRIAARAHEPDRYLSALLCPGPVRGDLIALAAFAGEIGRIPVIATEPMIGEIRLQWWRDALEAAQTGLTSANPIADRFGEAIRRHDLPQAWIARAIDAQSGALDFKPPRDEVALKARLADEHASLFQLAARILGQADNASTISAIDTAAIAYGLACTLRDAPAALAHGRALVPQTILSARATTIEALRSDSHKHAAGIALDLVAMAERAASDAKRELRNGPNAARLACLPLAMVTPYCNAAVKAGAHWLDRAGDVVPLTRAWRLLRARYGGL